MAAGAARAVCRVRLRRPHLRSRLVPAAAAVDRIVGGLARRAARRVHGRDVSRQPAAAAICRLRSRHPLQVYAFLELGIGAVRRARAVRVPIIGGIYTEMGGQRNGKPDPARDRREHLPAAADAADGCARCPSSRAGSKPRRAACRGSATSTAATSLGAVAGSLLAGFYLLRVYDMPTATMVAVALNVIVAVIALVVAAQDRRTSPAAVTAPAPRRAGSAPRLRCHRAVRHDGARRRGGLDAAAVAALRRHDVYVLVDPRGVPHGARHRQLHRRRASRGGVRIPACALGMVPARCCAVPSRGPRYTTSASLPYWPINPSIGKSPVYQFQLDLLRAFWVMLPAAILWGASFPLAIGAAAREGRTRRASSVASTPPTPSARSSARWSRASCWWRALGSQIVAAGADRACRRCQGCSCSADAGIEAQPDSDRCDDRRRVSQQVCSFAPCRRCRAFSSRTGATRRPGSA